MIKSIIQKTVLFLSDIYFSYTGVKKYKIAIGVKETKEKLICMFQELFEDESITINNDYYLYNNSFIDSFYKPYLLANIANSTDIIIYINLYTFCTDKEIDLKYLKKKRKKIVFLFNKESILKGNIESPKLIKQYHNQHSIDHYLLHKVVKSEVQEKIAIENARYADKYGDLIFIFHPIDQISYLKSKPLLWRYSPLNKFIENSDKFTTIDKLIITHVVLEPLKKGTYLVKAAIAALQREGYSFDFIELPNLLDKNSLKTLNSSHIFLNDFYNHGLDYLSIIAMANKNAVLTSTEYESYTNDKEAWLQTKYWEVYDNLKYLLDNPTKIEGYAETGYKLFQDKYTKERVKEFYDEKLSL